MARYSELTEEQKKELLFTAEERKQLDEARKMTIVYDEDCPAVTPEKALRFKRVRDVAHVKQA